MSQSSSTVSRSGMLALLIALLVIILDQILKVWIKTHFYLGEEYAILPWFRLDFVENNGMAFGWQFGSKFLLTLFRIVFVAFLIYCIVLLRNADLKKGFIVCVALVLAGAIGNIIDCMFYGLIFNDPWTPQVAVLFPPEGGYAPLFHGKVVDMLYFPLFSFDWPGWMPFIGGERFEFFRPVFNLADSAISIGVIVILLFYPKQLSLACNRVKEIFREKKGSKS